MPDHALYYPAWGISDPVFMAESLLYWDRLACIVPEDRKLRPWHADPAMQKVLDEAHELFVSPVVPTHEQKARAHERIKAFAELDPPEWCRPENFAHGKGDKTGNIIAIEKLDHDTVELLMQKGWMERLPGAAHRKYEGDYGLLHSAASNLILEALAEECSSPTMPPVTDDLGSFTTSCNLLLRELDAPTGVTITEGNPRSHTHFESDYAFLLAKVPILSLAPSSISPDVIRLILQARRESSIDEQRQMFRKKVDEYLEKLRSVEEPEKQVLADKFEDELKKDQDELGRELRRIGVGTILSKKGLVAIVLDALTGVLDLGLGLAIGLTRQLIDYGPMRDEVLKKHWSSWLFSATAGRITVW